MKIEATTLIETRDSSAPVLISAQDGEETGDEVAENLLSTKKISKNDFVFMKVVGRGSFGKVYLVKKKDKPDQPLALKVLAKDVVSKRNLMIKTQGKSE